MTRTHILASLWVTAIFMGVVACSDDDDGAKASCSSICGAPAGSCSDDSEDCAEPTGATSGCVATCTYFRDRSSGACGEAIDAWMSCAAEADWSCEGEGCGTMCSSNEQAAYACIAEDGETGGSGGGSSSGVCDQASQWFASTCPGYPVPTFEVCDDVNQCRAGCVISAVCDLQAQASCMMSCSGGAGGYGGEAGTGGYGGYGGDAGYGAEAGTGGYGGEAGYGAEGGYGAEAGSGGSAGTDIYPGCYTYASTYCGCLGEYASEDCYETIADGCDTMYDLCPSETLTYIACINAQSCQGDWLSACPFDCGG